MRHQIIIGEGVSNRGNRVYHVWSDIGENIRLHVGGPFRSLAAAERRKVQVEAKILEAERDGDRYGCANCNGDGCEICGEVNA